MWAITGFFPIHCFLDVNIIYIPPSAQNAQQYGKCSQVGKPNLQVYLNPESDIFTYILFLSVFHSTLQSGFVYAYF